MKKLAVIIFLGMLLTFPSCIVEPEEFGPKDTEIEGLELTFSDLNTENERSLSVLFRNESTGFFTTYDGSIFKTKDGGQNWTRVHSKGSEPLRDMFFVDDNNGWAVGGRSLCATNACGPKTGVFLQTKNGGETWQNVAVTISGTTELQSIWFMTPMSGIVVGASVHDEGTGLMLSTIDGGQAWQERHFSNVGGIMLDVEFADNKNGLVVCAFGRVLRTLDGGVNWIIEKPFPENGGNVISYAGPSIAYSGSNTLQKTLNGGVSWISMPSPNDNITELVFTSTTAGFLFGIGTFTGGDFGISMAGIHYTKDGGQTWVGTNACHEIEPITAASFPTATLGFGVSGNKMVKIRVK